MPRNPQTFDVARSLLNGSTLANDKFNEQIRVLEREGIQVGDTAIIIIEELRALGAKALRQGEDELANEIIQLVLMEKLRRKHNN